MNKRFSTLVAAALVAGGLSANAQVLSDTDLKTGDFVFLKTGLTAKALYINQAGKLDSMDLSATDSTILKLDSISWKVTVTKGVAASTFKFQNRGTNQYLSLKAKTGENAISAAADALSEWGYSTTNGIFANKGDSTYVVMMGHGSSAADIAGIVAKKGSTYSTMFTASSYAPVKVCKITTHFNLQAEDFNNYIQKFNFAAVNGRKDPATPSKGEANILTDNEWQAIPIHSAKYLATDMHGAVCDTVFFQLKSSAGKDSVDFLTVDTAYVTGTESFTLIKEDSLRKGSWADKDGKWTVAKNDSLYMFSVYYDYATDSMSIKPIALPKKLTSANATTGSMWIPATGAQVTTGLGQGGSTEAVIALRTLSKTTVLAVDSTRNFGAASGLSYANIHSTARTAELGGNAEIDAKKVYFIKYAGKADKDKAGKYVVAKGLVGATEKAYQTAKGNVAVPSSQWVVKAGNAKGLYTIENREFDNITFGGAFTQVMDGKEKVANTYVVNNDTILLEDANCASVENLITVSGHKRATTGYGYYDPEVLSNKKFKVASASPFMKDLFMQAKKDSSITLAEDENLFYLDKVGAAKFGAEVAGIDTLYRYTYKFVTKKGEYIARNTDASGNATAYILTKDPKYTASVFYFKSWGAADTYMMIDTTGIGATPDWTKAATVSVNAQNADIYPAALSAAKSDLFTVAELDAPSVLFTNPTHYNIYNNNDRLAVGKNNLAVMAQPGNDLKADADKFVNDNFTLWFDTVNYKADITASYFISQGIKAAAGEETKAEEASAERLYLTVASQDSIDKSDDLAKLYTLDGAARLYFRTAARHGVDTLIVNNFDEKAGVMAPDTVAAGADGTKHSADAAKGLLLGGIDNFKFQFEVIDGTDNYVMKSLTNKYVVSVNGLLVVKSDSDENMIASLKAPDYATSNEDVAVSEVTVIATEGGVQIAGAAGKKVVISNILGQVVANTVLTSDNAVIAAPQGVVVVAVEGEEAVKAIVK